MIRGSLPSDYSAAPVLRPRCPVSVRVGSPSAQRSGGSQRQTTSRTQRQLERVFGEVRELEKHPAAASESVESHQMIARGLSTAVDKALLARIGDAHLGVPEGFAVHTRVKPVLDRRREMAYARSTGRSASCWHWVH